MKLMKTTPRILSVIAALAHLSACTQNGAGLPFAEPVAAPEPSIAAPSVAEELAKEANEQRIIYHVGPIDLPRGTDLKAALEKPLTMRFQTDKSVWVTGFIPKIVDQTGAVLPKEILNQAVMYNMHEENPLCSGSPNPFAVATSMMTEVMLPQGYGYPILATDPLEARVVLVNNTDKEYSGVFFEIALITRTMSEYTTRADVRPMFLELEPCSHAPLEVPPGTFVERRATYPVAEKSSLVLAHGVLQDYGASISLTSGREIVPFWRSEALLDDAHRITGMSANPFEDASGITFKAGDRITLGIAYNNSSESWLKGASAAAMAYLAPQQ